MIARRGTAHGSGLGKQRWVVERGFAHLHNFRRLRIRYERYPELHTALLVLACSILCWRRSNHCQRPSEPARGSPKPSQELALDVIVEHGDPPNAGLRRALRTFVGGVFRRKPSTASVHRLLEVPGRRLGGCLVARWPRVLGGCK